MVENRRYQIGVIGRGRQTTDDIKRSAYDIGASIAQAGHILVCGGQGGVMEAAAEGAKAAGGVTVGILMSYDKNSANRFIDIRIPTGLHHARNVLVVSSSDAVIAIDGGHGTLCEIALALKLKIPVIGLQTWAAHSENMGAIDILRATSPQDAVARALDILRRVSSS